MLVNVQIIGDDRGVARTLRRLDTALNPIAMASFLGVTVDPYIRRRAEQRFQAEGDDVTGPWLPLAQETIEIRENQGFGAGPINSRTGELEEYITGTPGGVMPTTYSAVLTSPGTPASGHLLSKVQTAQKGKKYPSTMPRPVMGVNEQDLAWVMTALTGFIVQRVSGTRRGLAG